jgi:hypothetical protein
VMTNETGYPSGMPPWAKKVDDFGQRHWHKEKPLRSRRGEHIWAIIWNIVFLWIVNKVPDWNLWFINEHYNAVLIFLNINIYIQIGTHTLMAFLETRWAYHLLKIVSEASKFMLFILLYYLYPFDFSGRNLAWLDMLIPVFLIITMAITALSVLIHLFRLVFSRQ